MAISMTDTAQQFIGKQLQDRGKGLGVRLGVKTAGCSGLSYIVEFVDDIDDEDQVFSQGDFKLVVDPKSFVYLDGLEVDFVKEGFNEGLQFNNPNMKNECGCGESFHV